MQQLVLAWARYHTLLPHEVEEVAGQCLIEFYSCCQRDDNFTLPLIDLHTDRTVVLTIPESSP